MELRGTVYVTRGVGDRLAVEQIERFVWTFEAVDAADFKNAARARSECIGADVIFVEFGPIGPSWNR